VAKDIGGVAAEGVGNVLAFAKADSKIVEKKE
jgi:hypothetical protein